MLKKAKVLYYLNDKSYFNQRGLAEYIKNSDLKFVSKEEESINHFVSYLPAGTIFAQSYGIEEKSNITKRIRIRTNEKILKSLYWIFFT